MAGRRRNLDDLQGEIQELFSDMWQVPGFTGLRHGYRPQCDCFRTDDPPALQLVEIIQQKLLMLAPASEYQRAMARSASQIVGCHVLATIASLSPDASSAGRSGTMSHATKIGAMSHEKIPLMSQPLSHAQPLILRSGK